MFIEQIEQNLGHSLSPAIRDAFQHIDRRDFVPFFYDQVGGREWKKVGDLGKIYQDQALTTKLDKEECPISSSTQPSIMASMVEALEVHCGLDTLEIGTGTGYNAAILARLVGENGKVTTVDIDAELVSLARKRLKPYANVQVLEANGLVGGIKKEYDRVIVTGASSTIPWISLLKEGGILVAPLQGSLASPLYKLRRIQGEGKGTLLSTPAFFMQLHQGELKLREPINWKEYDSLPVVEEAEEREEIAEAVQVPSFKIFVEAALPGIELRPRFNGKLPIGPDSFDKNIVYGGSFLYFTSSRATVRGVFPLYSQLKALFREWEQRGRPEVDEYVMKVYAGGTYEILLEVQRV